LDRFLLLPLSYNIPRLLEDLAICESFHWANHYNQADYSGEWNGIALRSVSGQTDNILAAESSVYYNTPLLEKCGYFKEIIAGFDCELETIRLLALAPGSSIKTHRDRGLGYSMGCFRLHIPILTDPDVHFAVDGEKLPMQAGECWYANFDLPHSVHHQGKTRRVHLVVDGKRNAWTDALFGRAGYDFAGENQPIQYDDKTKRLMIEQLKAMGTETALKIAAALESGKSN
jgi:Aspartyl/Asparaginyl beta-hydroxylase